jgi:hypothetical protein
MRALTATELLWAWEHAIDQPAACRAITLLAPVCADSSPDQLARLPVGRRDARLMALRELTFGPRLASLSECPRCRETIELEFDVADVRVLPDDDPGDVVAPMTLRHGQNEITFRLPDTLDLTDAAAAGGPAAARLRLLERCVVSAREADGHEMSAGALPEDLAAAVAGAMAEADPQADVQLALVCPQCRHEWTAAFDIAGFLWAELQACAQRLLREVHELASAYGWKETDILSLSAARRHAYLKLLRA